MSRVTGWIIAAVKNATPRVSQRDRLRNLNMMLIPRVRDERFKIGDRQGTSRLKCFTCSTFENGYSEWELHARPRQGSFAGWVPARAIVKT
jgi:hypothetical protein